VRFLLCFLLSNRSLQIGDVAVRLLVRTAQNCVIFLHFPDLSLRFCLRIDRFMAEL
jgi:hypothetical protein